MDQLIQCQIDVTQAPNIAAMGLSLADSKVVLAWIQRDALFQSALKTITALLRFAVLQHCQQLRALFSFLMRIGISRERMRRIDARPRPQCSIW